MLAEPFVKAATSPPSFSQSLGLSRLKQPLAARNQPYYRSKTYVAQTGTTPLSKAAAPLFSIIIALQYARSETASPALYQHLIHEIKAFESLARAKDYSPEFITVARYALCATLDETLQTASGTSEAGESQQNLLGAFQQEQSANDRFFSILDHIRADPAHYLELLEIMYTCLSLGFEGRYRFKPERRHEFETLLDDLYHLIRGERGDVKKRLSVCKHWQKMPLLPTLQPLRLWRITLGGLLGLGLLYSAFHYALFAATIPLVNTVEQVSAYNTVPAALRAPSPAASRHLLAPSGRGE